MNINRANKHFANCFSQWNLKASMRYYSIDLRKRAINQFEAIKDSNLLFSHVQKDLMKDSNLNFRFDYNFQKYISLYLPCTRLDGWGAIWIKYYLFHFQSTC